MASNNNPAAPAVNSGGNPFLTMAAPRAAAPDFLAAATTQNNNNRNNTQASASYNDNNSINIPPYSGPISTLVSQGYDNVDHAAAVVDSRQHHPAGGRRRQRLHLFIKANANCCIEGGVETILKLQSQNVRYSVDSPISGAGAGDAVGNSSGSMYFNNDNEQQQPISNNDDVTAIAAAAGTTTDDARGVAVSQQQQETNNSDAATAASDPFSFLQESEDDTTTTMATTATTSAAIRQQPQQQKGGGTHSTKKKGGGAGSFGMGRLIRKVAKTTTGAIERGIHTMAIAAEGGSSKKSPDQFVACLYYDDQESLLIAMTEQQPFPSESVRYQGIRFMIPLTIAASLPDDASLTLKLYIKSGAALLQQSSKVFGSSLANKSYLIGETRFQLGSQLRAPLVAAPTTAHCTTVSLQSNCVVDARVTVSVIPDLKFARCATTPTRNNPRIDQMEQQATAAALAGGGGVVPHNPFAAAAGPAAAPASSSSSPSARGWSLTDPDVMTAYNGTTTARLYNLPLDQSYGYSLAMAATGASTAAQSSASPQGGVPQASSSSSSSCLLVATERTTESTVVLPIATAVAQLASHACKQSLHHAYQVSQQLWLHRHDSAPPAASTNTPAQQHTSAGSSSGTAGHQPHSQSQAAEYADVSINIGSLKTVVDGNQQQQQGAVVVAVSWQRPDSIFECELLQPTTMMPSNNNNDVNVRFYPKPCRENILPAILQATQGRLPANTGFFLGGLRVQVTITKPAAVAATAGATSHKPQQRLSIENPFGDVGPGMQTSSQHQHAPVETDTWECILALEPLINLQQPQQSAKAASMNVPLYQVSTGRQMGLLSMNVAIAVHNNSSHMPTQVSIPLEGGLVSLMGLDMPVHGSGSGNAKNNALDVVVTNTNPSAAAAAAAAVDTTRRRQQLATMGSFITYAYVDHHVKAIRSKDSLELDVKSKEYRLALQQAVDHQQGQQANTSTPRLAPHHDRTPKPFRPSSSRTTSLLAGIPFNVHAASFSLNVMEPCAAQQQNQQQLQQGDEYCNITCGAPADHARGFGNVMSLGNGSNGTSSGGVANTSAVPNAKELGLTSPIGTIQGGLRRLEMKRQELISAVDKLQAQLIMHIANYMMDARKTRSHTTVNHVPARHEQLQSIRWRCYEAVQTLHHVTWVCAVRRAAVFSQALAIAVTSYLTTLSSPEKMASPSRQQWLQLWSTHGYLVSFEGLLSAAGKELGMIEDAYTGIAMLQRVSVVLVPSTAPSGTHAVKVPIPQSPFLRWLSISTSGVETQTQYLVQIGVDASYINHSPNGRPTIPQSLRDTNRPIRFYSILFEVGVDIRQWGANQLSNNSSSANPNTNSEQPDASNIGGGGGGLLLDDDDDNDPGEIDTDVLVQLNYEAFQKLNAYAHAIRPIAGMGSAGHAPQQQMTTHPLLETLHQHIVSSAGKMNHDILLEAAGIIQQHLGGSTGIVFCKSGKDRTAMHVTYKQAKFSTRFRQDHGPGPDGFPVPDTTLQDAALLRLYGTRLPICEKNVGQAKYAFNSLQVKFMPEALRPPPNTLAGFLKGGKVFGGIES